MERKGFSLKNANSLITALSLVIALVSLALSLYTTHRYNRDVAYFAAQSDRLAEDFGLKQRTESPRTLSEALDPMFSMSESLQQ